VCTVGLTKIHTTAIIAARSTAKTIFKTTHVLKIWRLSTNVFAV
jgi:hypothetical protein